MRGSVGIDHAVPLCVAEEMLAFGADATAWRPSEFPIWKERNESCDRINTDKLKKRSRLLAHQRREHVLINSRHERLVILRNSGVVPLRVAQLGDVNVQAPDFPQEVHGVWSHEQVPGVLWCLEASTTKSATNKTRQVLHSQISFNLSRS